MSVTIVSNDDKEFVVDKCILSLPYFKKIFEWNLKTEVIELDYSARIVKLYLDYLTTEDIDFSSLRQSELDEIFSFADLIADDKFLFKLRTYIGIIPEILEDSEDINQVLTVLDPFSLSQSKQQYKDIQKLQLKHHVNFLYELYEGDFRRLIKLKRNRQLETFLFRSQGDDKRLTRDKVRDVIKFIKKDDHNEKLMELYETGSDSDIINYVLQIM